MMLIKHYILYLYKFYSVCKYKYNTILLQVSLYVLSFLLIIIKNKSQSIWSLKFLKAKENIVKFFFRYT